MLTRENGSTIDRVRKDEQGWIFGGVKGEKIEWEMECCQDRREKCRRGDTKKELGRVRTLEGRKEIKAAERRNF